MASLVSIISFTPSLEKLKYMNRGKGHVASLPCRTSINWSCLTMHTHNNTYALHEEKITVSASL